MPPTSAAASTTASLRSARTTRAPSAAKRAPIPWPMPPPAPVTTTVRPSKRDMRGLLLVTCARDGRVPGGDARAARRRRLLRHVELARAVERFQLRLRPEPRDAPGEVRDAEP